ncbi:MAG TPA: iron-sulfur cluster assembly scaffold protein [Planctomycetota bacterium]|nr:iron-sulfur cluster assembly scaffold protein [Planctomycetota bacterium]
MGQLEDPVARAMDYSQKVVQLFLHPQHLGTISETDAAPGEKIVQGEAGNLIRGDALRLSLKVSQLDERILDAKFQNLGASLPIASGSHLCSILIGKTLSEALKITAQDLDRELEGLPELRNKQPVLALEALEQCVRKFREQPSPREKKPAPREMMVCYCFQVPESILEKNIRVRKLKTIDEVMDATNAGCGCHTCHPDIEDVLERCARGEFKYHIAPDEYAAAQRLYGVPPPTEEELAKNPPGPPPPPSTDGAPDRTARVADDGFVYPENSPVAALASVQRAKAKKNAKPWPEMSADERVARIQEVLKYDLRPAIRTDGGDIQFVSLDGDKVRVTLHGHCKNCHSATSTLKNGVEKRLQDAVWPALEVEEVFDK